MKTLINVRVIFTHNFSKIFNLQVKIQTGIKILIILLINNRILKEIILKK